MSKFETLEEAQRAIRIGERSRILFEMLLSEIGLEFENTHSEVWIKLRDVQQDYEDAIKSITEIIKHTKLVEQEDVRKEEMIRNRQPIRGSADAHPNEKGVSVSN